MSIEAMKQALEALETTQTLMRLSDPQYVREYNAITSLRQAIAEAEKQEPHGYLKLSNAKFYYEVEGVPNIDNNPEFLALYTHPQPKREPLTIEQLREHWRVAKVLDMTDAEIDFADYVLIARDVEALYGITGDMKQEHVAKTAKQRHEENT